MPRHRVRKTVTRYDPKSLADLADLVKESGQSISSVAKQHNVPKETLRRWVISKPSKCGSGGRTVLSAEEESTIVTALEFLSSCGYPQGRQDVKRMVYSYINSIGRKTPFNDGLPGDDWMLLFERRHSDSLKRRKPETLTVARATALTEEVVNTFFDMYEKKLKENDLLDKPHRIYNLDETGLNTDRRSDAVFVRKQSRDAYIKSPTSGKTTYSVLFAVSASGKFLPPFVIYKSKHLYESWTSGGPRGTGYSCSDSGWMMDFNFENWFTKHFVKHVEDLDKPVLLSFDGHNSHLTYNTVKAAIDNNIILLCLPPNTSHALQPLDVGVFRPAKVIWRKVLNTWFTESRMESVDKAVFPRLLARLWQQLQPQNAIGGFRGSGLYPANRKAVMHRVTQTLDTSKPTSSSIAATSDELNIQSTPRKLLRKAIIEVIAPTPSADTIATQDQKKRNRKRVQSKVGEVLTEEDVLERMREEEETRKQKTIRITEKNMEMNKPGSSRPAKKRKLIYESSESDREEMGPSSGSSDGERGGKEPVASEDLQVDSFVIIVYEGQQFPGQVMDIGKKTVTVKCMSKAGPAAWKWPQQADIHTYPAADVISVIKPPTPCGCRGQWRVPEIDRYW